MNELLLLKNYFVEDIKKIRGDIHYYHYKNEFLEKIYLESIEQIDKILSDSSIKDHEKKSKYLEYISELLYNFHNNINLMSHWFSDDYDELLWNVSKLLHVDESEILCQKKKEHSKSIKTSDVKSIEKKENQDNWQIRWYGYEINKEKNNNETYTNDEAKEENKSLIYKIFKKKR